MEHQLFQGQQSQAENHTYGPGVNVIKLPIFVFDAAAKWAIVFLVYNFPIRLEPT
jgi:hypothetical protein